MKTHNFDPDGDIALLMVLAAKYAKNTKPAESETEMVETPRVEAATIETPRLEAGKIETTNTETEKEKETNDAPVLKDPGEDVRLLVSSKHLILASSVFKVMLSDRFKEDQTLRASGFLELPLPEDDVPAFLILLNIIHGHTRKVPRQLGLDRVAKIAILVDKYQLQEVVAVHSDHWMRHLEPMVPKHWTNDMNIWLCIFWVFEHASQFTNVTRILQRNSKGTITIDGLPIPPVIIDTINTTKRNAIEWVISSLEKHISQYEGPTLHCTCKSSNFECDSMVLGALIKGSIRIGLWPPAKRQVIDTSFNHLCQMIRSIDIRTMCNHNATLHKNSMSYYRSDSKVDGVCCNPKGSIDASLVLYENGLNGLEIKTFKS